MERSDRGFALRDRDISAPRVGFDAVQHAGDLDLTVDRFDFERNVRRHLESGLDPQLARAPAGGALHPNQNLILGARPGEADAVGRLLANILGCALQAAEVDYGLDVRAVPPLDNQVAGLKLRLDLGRRAHLELFGDLADGVES